MTTITDWTPDELPSVEGKTFAITGGNSGIGLEAAKLLCCRGAGVVITSRSAERGADAARIIREAAPGARVAVVPLDLTEPGSIERAAKEIVTQAPHLDALVNNAGVMQAPERRTSEGFELQFATNYLGHFRLNAALLEHLEHCGSRVVTVSSIMHKTGFIAWGDLQSERRYNATRAYAQSKLANLMYAFELDRRLRERGSSVTSVAAHPGYAATNLQTAGVSLDGGQRVRRSVMGVATKALAQSAERGAFPLVLAAADQRAEGGKYYGPTGVGGMRGPVGEVSAARHATYAVDLRRLWDLTEDLVGPFFDN